MIRFSLRRAGATFLFLLWAQVATANALPCGLSCLRGEEVGHHHHEGQDEDHAVGHHMAGAKISAPEYCGTPQLLVTTFVPAEFPVSPSTNVAVLVFSDTEPATFVSA